MSAIRRHTAKAIGTWALISLIIAIMGPFGTVDMPHSDRLMFWGLIIGLNMAKWQVWYALLPRVLPDRLWAHVATALAGALLLNLTLHLEIQACYRLIGYPYVVPFGAIYPTAVLLSGLFSMIGALARLRESWRPAPAVPAGTADAAGAATSGGDTAMPAPPTGLLARAGLGDAAGLLAVEAEDHYLRLHLADGRRPLVHYRFRDAVLELAGLDGLQVHRGFWVAAAAVTGVERRDGRKWALRLSNGLSVPVSESHVGAVRRRGWMNRAA